MSLEPRSSLRNSWQNAFDIIPLLEIGERSNICRNMPYNYFMPNWTPLPPPYVHIFGVYETRSPETFKDRWQIYEWYSFATF